MGTSFNRPLIGTAIVIRRHGKVLLHLRKGEHASGLWGFPGGHLEMWEDPEDTVVRETAEEAGDDIKFTSPQFWTIANTMFHDEGKHYVCLFYISDWTNGEAMVMEPEKCEKWDWFKWNELPENLMPGIKILKEKELNPFLL